MWLQHPGVDLDPVGKDLLELVHLDIETTFLKLVEDSGSYTSEKKTSYSCL